MLYTLEQKINDLRIYSKIEFTVQGKTQVVFIREKNKIFLEITLEDIIFEEHKQILLGKFGDGLIFGFDQILL